MYSAIKEVLEHVGFQSTDTSSDSPDTSLHTTHHLTIPSPDDKSSQVSLLSSDLATYFS